MTSTITVRIVLSLVCVLVLVTFINQLRLFLKVDYETETAVSFSSTEVIRFDGVYVRRETIIPKSAATSAEVYSYSVADGSKVAADSIVANVYQNRNEIITDERIRALQDEIAIVEEQQNPGTTAIAQPEFISSLINDAYRNVLVLEAKNDLSALPEARTKLRTLMGIHRIVTKAEPDYKSRVAELSRELAALQITSVPPLSSVTADNSGYFISYTDGLENLLTPDTIHSLPASAIENIIKNGNAGITYDAAVGKLVSGYEWQMIGIINPAEAHFKTGAQITLKIPEDDVSVSVTITEIIETDDPDKRILVLSCSEFRAEFARQRVCKAELVLNDFTGIRIPRSAIRFNAENEKGVYILQGKKVLFKKIYSIFETDDYIISSTPDNSYVSLYDDVIIEGDVSPALVEYVTTAADEEADTTETEQAATDTTTAIADDDVIIPE
jgi:putative membrane fusion protein